MVEVWRMWRKLEEEAEEEEDGKGISKQQRVYRVFERGFSSLASELVEDSTRRRKVMRETYEEMPRGGCWTEYLEDTKDSDVN